MSDVITRVSNVGHVCFNLLTYIVAPNLEKIHTSAIILADPLSTDQGRKNLAANSKAYKNRGVKECLPLFVWNRGPLNVSDVMEDRGRLSVYNKNKDVNGDIPTYKGGHSYFDIEYIYACNTAQQLEEFEIDFVSREGFSSSKVMCVNHGPSIGDFEYELFWNTLDSKVMQVDETDVKEVRGSVRVRGFFFSSENNPVNLVNCILINVKSFDGDPLTKDVIL